jgi:hypothetical protein
VQANNAGVNGTDTFNPEASAYRSNAGTDVAHSWHRCGGARRYAKAK